MLDLKAKLASAGLVSQQDIERAEKEKRARKHGSPGNAKRGNEAPQNARKGLRIDALRKKTKGEQYEAIRKMVGERRLDPVTALPSENARPFHFSEANGRIGRLVLEPEMAKMLEDGKAALVTYMSNHGIAHAVLPPEDAADIAELFPKWLRVLAGDERAGQVDERPPAK